MNMNKKTVTIIVFLAFAIGLSICLANVLGAKSLFAPTTQVAQYVAENPCDEDAIRRVLKIFGYILLVAKVAVPLIIIGFATVDLFKAVVDKDEKSLWKQLKQVGIRVIAGIIVFFVPNIVNAVFALSDSLGIVNTNQFKTCASCVLDPLNNSMCTVQD